MDYKKLLYSDSKYECLKTDFNGERHIILIGVSGSHAYGTNDENSDLDIRAIALEKPDEIIGFNKFESYRDEENDITVYGFSKMCELLENCNPNIIEILGLNDEHYLYLSPFGEELLQNKDMFLSKRCYFTFTKYADDNLARLENMLARNTYSEKKKNEHIAVSLKGAIESFNLQHDTTINPMSIYVTDEGELRINFKDVDINGDELEALYSTISNTLRNYRAVKKFNSEKDIKHINKHAYNLIRLYNMCYDLLKTGEIKTFRTYDHDLLMDIKNGKYITNEGLSSEFYNILNDLRAKCRKAYEESALPDRPDKQRLEAFMMEVKKYVITER